jgi:hypothetical protein
VICRCLFGHYQEVVAAGVRFGKGNQTSSGYSLTDAITEKVWLLDEKTSFFLNDGSPTIEFNMK